MNHKVLFLCPHHAAKSVIAAEYFTRAASQQALPFEGISAGTEPDHEIYPQVIALLGADGIDVSGQKPRLVTDTDLATASCVVSIGCDIDARVPAGVVIEHWDDIPPVSEDAERSARAILDRVEHLLLHLTGKESNNFQWGYTRYT